MLSVFLVSGGGVVYADIAVHYHESREVKNVFESGACLLSVMFMVCVHIQL